MVHEKLRDFSFAALGTLVVVFIIIGIVKYIGG